MFRIVFGSSCDIESGKMKFSLDSKRITLDDIKQKIADAG